MITPPFQNERRNLYRKMNNRFSKRKSRTGFSAKIIGAVIFSFLVFGIVTGVIGFCIFRYSLKKEYDASTRSMALSAAALVNGDRIDDYLGRRDAAGYSSEKALLEAEKTAAQMKDEYLSVEHVWMGICTKPSGSYRPGPCRSAPVPDGSIPRRSFRLWIDGRAFPRSTSAAPALRRPVTDSCFRHDTRV